MSVDEDPIHFQSVEEFTSRPSYVSPLRIASEELEKISGKYIFPFEIACSLNGCTRPHKRGFIIRTKSGLETNCGHQCGKREFDVDWDELHARFEKAEDAALARKMADQLLQERDALLSQTQSAVLQLDTAAKGISFFNECFGRHLSFRHQLDICLKQGGGVMADKPRTEFDIQNNRPAVRMLVASIRGAGALVTDYSALRNSLSYTHIPWLQSLEIAQVQSQETRQIQALLKQAQAAREQVAKAERFIVDALAFNTPENARAFEAIRSLLMRKGRDRDDLEQVIQKWANNLPQLSVTSVSA